MSRVFKPQIQAPAAPPAPTTTLPATDPAAIAQQKKTQKALEEAEDRELRAKGRASTILTGGAGLQDKPALASRVLLGG